MSRVGKATPRVAKGVLLYAIALGVVAIAAFSLVGCGGSGKLQQIALANTS